MYIPFTWKYFLLGACILFSILCQSSYYRTISRQQRNRTFPPLPHPEWTQVKHFEKPWQNFNRGDKTMRNSRGEVPQYCKCSRTYTARGFDMHWKCMFVLSAMQLQTESATNSERSLPSSVLLKHPQELQPYLRRLYSPGGGTACQDQPNTFARNSVKDTKGIPGHSYSLPSTSSH